MQYLFTEKKSSLNNSNFNPNVGLNVFVNLIRPIMIYGSEIWGAINSGNNSKDWFERKNLEAKFEKLHLHFCKYILNVNGKTTNMAVYGELGRYPLYTNVWKQVIKYFDHIQGSEDDSLVRSAYEEAYEHKIVKGTYLNSINMVFSKFDAQIDKHNWNEVVGAMRLHFEEIWHNTLNKNKENNGNK